MCGIIGIASSNAKISLEWVEHCNNLQRHRGPDNLGYWKSKDSTIILGHQRLSIIDLSNSGNQPMSDTGESIIVTFNGEIYNYRELKNTLTKSGYIFKTKTDTEVIIAAYKFWGINFLDKLIGMFAIAIVDMDNKKLFLCRDRAGEKPLYYSRQKNNIYFSSELKSLLECKEFDLTLSESAVETYFSIGHLPGAMTIVDSVSKVLPGEYIEYDLDNSQLSKNFYWQLKDISFGTETSYDLFEEIMKSSVELQLHADVPVGLLLSGGVDSTIVCYMATLLNKKIKTFTFTNKDSPSIDESKHASDIAAYLGTEHNTIDSGEISNINLIDIISLLDEPFSDSSFIPTYLLTKEIKKYCTVAIGGDGADELFGGYKSYQNQLKHKFIIDYFPRHLKKFLLKVINSTLPVGLKGRNYLNSMLTDIDHYKGNLLFDTKLRNQLLKFDNNGFCVDDYLSSRCLNSTDKLRNLMYCDFTNYLPDDILFKTDRASMLNSLELRSPFLDKKVIEFASGMKKSNLTTKYSGKIFLKKFLQDKFPSNFKFDRKQGFSVSLKNLLSQSFLSEIINDISDNDQILNKKFIDNVFDSLKNGYSNHERLYSIIVFHVWRKNYQIGL